MNVMITGASGGLGRALAAECAGRGYNLFLTDINERGLMSLQRGLECHFNVCVTTRTCDLTKEESVDEMLAVIDASGVRFDMLLNVAGVDYEGGFLERDSKSILQIVSLNIEATLRITHAILSRRRPGKHFSLVFVSSLAAMFPMPLKATYAASKRFLLDFAVALRQEMKNNDADVLVICPAGLATTKEVIGRIAAQGVWGSLTTNKLESIACRTIDKALRGRNIYVPGIVNRMLFSVGRILPRSWVAAAIYRQWHKAQSKCYAKASW